MTVIPELDSRPQPADPNGTNTASSRQDSVDVLVSDFLQELSGLSAEIGPVQESRTEPGKLVEKIPVIGAEQAFKADIPEPVSFQDEVVSEPELDVAAIDRDIDATLADLERQKSSVVPIGDRKNFTPEPAPPPSRNSKQPAAAPSAPPAAKASARAAPKSQEPEWQRLDMFRTEIASSRLSKRRRAIYFTLAAVLLMAILIYFLILESDRFIQLFERVTDSGLYPSDTCEKFTA